MTQTLSTFRWAPCYSRPAETEVRSWVRFPTTAAPAVARAVSWAGVRVTDNEPRFSSTRDARRVPGIGTEATPRAFARYRSHASATCAGVASCSSATDL